MAYIPWWQRMSPPTFAERFELGGLAGRVGFKDNPLKNFDTKESGPIKVVEEHITKMSNGKYRFRIRRGPVKNRKLFSKTLDTLEEAQKLKSDFLKTSPPWESLKGGTYSLPKEAEEWWSALSEKEKSRYKWNVKGKTLKEIWEASYGNPNISEHTRSTIKSAYEGNITKSKKMKDLAKKGYITLEQFSDEIGAHPGSLTKSLGFRKQYPMGSPSFLAKYPKLKELVYVHPGSLKDTHLPKYYIKRPSEKVVDSLKEYFVGGPGRVYNRRGFLTQDTIKKVQYASKNKVLMENLKNWKKGDKISEDLIKRVFGPEGVGESTIMQLGRVLQGKVDVPGIEKDIKLGNKIIEALKESSKKSGFNQWQTQAYKYARHEMDTIFKPGERTFQGYQRLLHKLFKEFGLKNFNIDEINALQTGWKSGTSPYTLFTQAIDDRINQNQKRLFDGGSSRRQTKLRLALRSGDKKTALQLIKEQDEAIKMFYKNNPGTEGKVKLPSFDLREPWQVFGEKRWNSLHPDVKKAITKSWDKVGFSLDVGKGALTQKELAETLQKKIKNKAVRNIALKSIGTMMSLSFGALNQAIGAPIKNIPISEKIPVIGGGELPMTATGQVKDISDLLSMVKNWEEGKKVKKIEEEIASQAGSNTTGVDQYIINRGL